jgi:quinoprotein dehydrogenase-associated probable ABC transporter substrate-binding protein
MCSAYKRIGAGLMVWTLAVSGAAAIADAGPAALRVCSDPNNMPFSNRNGEGFENKIAALLAHDLGRPLAYFWSPQRRGFLRNTLMAERCDVVMGVPANYERVRPTRAYYRSSYAFVSRAERHLAVSSFDDPRLAALTIGIQITGNDYQNPPAAQALAARHLIQNVRGYTVYGDYSKPDPQSELVDAVANGTVDIAVVWGPLAGYYARRVSPPLNVTPVRPAANAPPSSPGIFAFDIAMAVRPDDHLLHDALDAAIVRRQGQIRRILTSFGVPLL